MFTQNSKTFNDEGFDNSQCGNLAARYSLGLPIKPNANIPANFVDKGKIAYSELNNAIIYCDGFNWFLVGQGTGSVNLINAGVGLTGGPITTIGTISIANTTVSPGTYSNSRITINAQGQITAASNGLAGITNLTSTNMTIFLSNLGGGTWNVELAPTTVVAGAYTFPSSVTVNPQGQITAISSGSPPATGTVTNIATGTGLTGGPITNAGTISLMNTAVAPGSYTLSNITVDPQGRITSASNGSAVTNIATGTGLTGGPITSTGTINLANTAVVPGIYNFATITVDSQGRITSASNGTAGSVTSIATGIGLTGGPITTTGTISLANTTVVPGSYTLSNITVDAQGRITSASNGTAGSVTSIATGTGLTGGPITTIGTISLANTAVTPGPYTLSNITVDAQGRITSASNGTAVTSITAGIGLTGGPITTTGTISLANTAVAPGSYTLSNITVDAQGRITFASNGTAGSVTSIATGTGLTGGPITNAGTISLTNTAVTPGSYTLTNITVDAQGRITSASNGTAVTSIIAGIGLAGGTITTTGTISLANTAVVPGSYTLTNITVDAQGRITSASNGAAAGTVTNIATGTGLTGGPITTTGTISLANTSVVPGLYVLTSLTVDAQGRLTAAASGSVTAGNGISVTGTTSNVIVNQNPYGAEILTVAGALSLATKYSYINDYTNYSPPYDQFTLANGTIGQEKTVCLYRSSGSPASIQLGLGNFDIADNQYRADLVYHNSAWNLLNRTNNNDPPFYGTRVGSINQVVVGDNTNAGSSIAFSADQSTCIVGAPAFGGSVGTAYVFTYNKATNTFTQFGPALTGAGEVGAGAYGSSVSISGDGTTIAIGGFNDNGGIGAVWMYILSSGAYIPQGAKIVPAGGSTPFYGRQVSLSGDGNHLILAGNNNIFGVGAFWYFNRAGGVWTQRQGPTSPFVSGGAAWGFALAISADSNTLVMGGPNANTNVGTAVTYTRSGNTWSQQSGLLVPSDIGAGAPQFGEFVSISADGNTILIGATAWNTNIGAVWVYNRNTAGTWTQTTSALNPTGRASSGLDVLVTARLNPKGNAFIMAYPNDNLGAGAIWNYTLVDQNGNWIQKTSTKITNGIANSQFGQALSVGDDGISTVSAPNNSFGGFNIGGFHVVY